MVRVSRFPFRVSCCLFHVDCRLALRTLFVARLACSCFLIVAHRLLIVGCCMLCVICCELFDVVKYVLICFVLFVVVCDVCSVWCSSLLVCCLHVCLFFPK